MMAANIVYFDKAGKNKLMRNNFQIIIRSNEIMVGWSKNETNQTLEDEGPAASGPTDSRLE